MKSGLKSSHEAPQSGIVAIFPRLSAATPRDGNTHVNFCMHDGDVT